MNDQEYGRKYDVLFDKTQKILQYYSCPRNCNACCRGEIIVFDKEEYNNLIRVVDDRARSIIEANTINPQVKGLYRAFTDRECPLILKFKCRIYENRPETCRKYPFEFKLDSRKKLVVELVLCPLSMKIIRDLSKWYKSINVVKSERYKKLYDQYKNSKAKHNNIRIELGESVLDGLIEYLDKK